MKGIKRLIKKIIYRFYSVEHRFKKIYKNNSWGGQNGQFYSGAGSEFIQAKEYISYVNGFISKNNIKSIVDIGCGDFQIASHFDVSNTKYIGVDIVQSLIDHNNLKYSGINVRFAKLNILSQNLPDGQLCLIKEVFQHLSNKDIISVIPKLSKYKYVIITDLQPKIARNKINYDKLSGIDTRVSMYNSGLYLEASPFNINCKPILFYDKLGSSNRCFRSILVEHLN
jgi:SAM-dependent methyltransferase